MSSAGAEGRGVSTRARCGRIQEVYVVNSGGARGEKRSDGLPEWGGEPWKGENWTLSTANYARLGWHLGSPAREVGRLTGWKQKIFGRRYQAIVISGEAAAQIERLKYVLSHGVKEGLVERVREWPGVHAVRALTEGAVLEGYWFDRTQEYAARRRREDFGRFEYATREVLILDPMPCWKHLPEEERQRRAAVLVEEIEAEAAIHREKTGIKPLGAAAVLTQHPHRQPLKTKKSPAPAIHAASQAVRRAFRDLYREFVLAFRQAAEKLQAGDRDAVFPLGSFPPALPFVDG